MMRSADFGSIVSPRGASAAPRTNASLHSSSREPRGGLASLKLMRARHALGQAGAPRIAQRPGPLDRARASLGFKKGGAVLPKSKKTVDMVENGRVVVRHQFYGKDAAEAAHMMRSHEKADRSFADAMAGKPYKGIDIKAVKRASGGLVGYAGGGDVPSYTDYLGSGAAPQGLSPDAYKQDYLRYLAELEQADEPVTGRALKFRDPERVAQIRAERTRTLPLALGSGAWSALPWLAGMVPGLALIGGDVAKAAGAPEWLPSWGNWSSLPKYAGVPVDDPVWRDSADLVNLGALAITGPASIAELARAGKSLGKAGMKKLRGYRREPSALEVEP